MNVNVSELTATLASERLKEHYKRNFTISHGFEPSDEQVEEIIYEKDKDGNIEYKDSAKDLYNDLYSMFEEIIKSSENIDGILIKYEQKYDNYSYLKHPNLTKVFIDEFLVKLEEIITPLVKTKIADNVKQYSIGFILKKRK